MADLFDRYPDGPGFTNNTTSMEAAEAVAPSAQTLRDRVLYLVSEAGAYGFTTNELATAMHINRDSIQPRTSELKADGKIVDSGKRRHNENGKRAIVWTLPKFKKEEDPNG